MYVDLENVWIDYLLIAISELIFSKSWNLILIKMSI